jgi:hypothetical protein
MSDELREAQIRNNERHHIAYLLEQHGDTIVSYLSDPRDAVKLIAYLLRLEANRDSANAADTADGAR